MSTHTTGREFLIAQLSKDWEKNDKGDTAFTCEACMVYKDNLGAKGESIENLEQVIEKYADLRIKEYLEEQKISSETFLLEVKNIDCDFETLRDKLEIISPSFTIDKDTFIYHAATKTMEATIARLAKYFAKRGFSIILTKS